MTTKSFKPINIIQMPNHFHKIDTWKVYFDQDQTLAFRLFLTDGLGERRFIPSQTTTAQVIFLRARDYVVSGRGSESQTFSVNAFFESADRSILTFQLTKEQSKKVYPGTVIVTLTADGKTERIKQNFILKVEKITGGC